MHTKLNKIKNEIKTRSLEWLTVCYCHFFLPKGHSHGFGQKGCFRVDVSSATVML